MLSYLLQKMRTYKVDDSRNTAADAQAAVVSCPRRSVPPGRFSNLGVSRAGSVDRELVIGVGEPDVDAFDVDRETRHRIGGHERAILL